MSFYSWIIQNHLNDCTPTGTVARVMKANSPMFRRARGYTKNRIYLERLTNRPENLDAFEKAWETYGKLNTQERHA